MDETAGISAIVPIGDRYDESGQLAKDYLDALDALGRPFELVFVLDGKRSRLAEKLLQLSKEDSRLRIIQLAKSFGEATALAAGLENTSYASCISSSPKRCVIRPSALKRPSRSQSITQSYVCRRRPCHSSTPCASEPIRSTS